MGARTDAARSEVLAARAGLDEELVRLDASGRAAVDIPTRLKREPAKVLGTAGGAAFLLLGGPKRVFKGVRQAIFGPLSPASLARSLLGDAGPHRPDAADALSDALPGRRAPAEVERPPVGARGGGSTPVDPGAVTAGRRGGGLS